jgi:hypothetical protein
MTDDGHSTILKAHPELAQVSLKGLYTCINCSKRYLAQTVCFNKTHINDYQNDAFGKTYLNIYIA